MKRALIISCFEWYKNRLEPVREVLLEKGYIVTVLSSDYSHITKETKKEKYDECEYIHVPHYKRNLSLQRIWSHLYFGKKANEYINRINPDLLYLIVPPNNTAHYCLEYKRKNPKIVFILDIIDLWPESMPLRKLNKTPLAMVWKSMRDRAIQSADHVFTECDLYKKELKDILNPARTSTLYLFKEQSEEEKKLVNEIIENRKDLDQGIIRFAYLGSINHIIDIESICFVIKQFAEEGYTCELHVIGDGESAEQFEKAVRETGCITFFYGPVFDEIQKIRILTPCDYAFNMMKDDISVGLTIKSIDYMSYGLPLINNIKGDTWRLVEDEGVGINFEKGKINNKPVHHEKVKMIFDTKFSRESFIMKVKTVF